MPGTLLQCWIIHSAAALPVLSTYGRCMPREKGICPCIVHTCPLHIYYMEKDEICAHEWNIFMWLVKSALEKAVWMKECAHIWRVICARCICQPMDSLDSPGVNSPLAFLYLFIYFECFPVISLQSLVLLWTLFHKKHNDLIEISQMTSKSSASMPFTPFHKNHQMIHWIYRNLLIN